MSTSGQPLRPYTSHRRTLDSHQVIEALRRAVPGQQAAALHEPEFGGREWVLVKECLDTGWVSSVGAYVSRFERMLADITGAANVIAVVNGTAALHIALLVAGVERGNEVLMPALTFVATANAVAYLGAVPHFLESEERTLGVDPTKLADYLGDIAEMRDGICCNRTTGARIAAIVPVHIFGHPVDMDPILDLADRYKLSVIEDAAEALGTRYKGRSAGTLGRLGTLSFNGNKIVTTGGGGAVLTADRSLADRIRHLTTTAKRPHAWVFDHDEVGFNYRMPNLNAALGCAQLEQLPRFLIAKRALAETYQRAFSGVDGVAVFEEPGFAESNYWLNALLLDEPLARSRDNVLEATNANGFGARPPWTLMHRLPMYQSCPRMDLATTEALVERIINLPSSAKLGEATDAA